MNSPKTKSITFIGGGSQTWAPTIIRDIVFKKGMEAIFWDIRLLDTDPTRTEAVVALFKARFQEWKVDWARVRIVPDPVEALAHADFVIIAISTGRLEAMKHDLKIPERYGIYHTVGDTAGPGGWSRALRNIPVFSRYARLIRKHAPKAFVLNYTNPMGALTKVLCDELGDGRVAGLCHGLFECISVLRAIFNLKSDADLSLRFGGVNHFFWILDFRINGRNGYEALRKKMGKGGFAALVKEVHRDNLGFHSNKLLSGELLDHYGYLPYVGDRHTCEFFGCYITSREQMKRFKLERTGIAFRRANYRQAEKSIRLWTAAKHSDERLSREPSSETAADIIKALAFNESFTDVVNMANRGQISNLPLGAVVETMGHVDAGGFLPIVTGELTESIRALVAPHAEAQVRTVRAGLTGDMNEALMALAADPVCSGLTISDVRKMGLELLKANRRHLPQFFNDTNGQI